MQAILTFAVAMAQMGGLPEIRVDADNVVVKTSCRLIIAPGAIIRDEDGDGVIHVAASDVTVEFEKGSVLRGAAPDARPDGYRGYGIRIDGHKNVTIRGGRIRGFWCGIHASDADGLTLEDVDASDMRRARLKSTPTAENAVDWLRPHYNDQNEWLSKYGAAMYVEDSKRVTVRRCVVRDGQNALILDRVTDAKIYDNDFSFNSGWGIALWRSSRNLISRNALDFCVRGYSHGVYNRGQDSAGILVFEQCHRNVIAENSATHCGDAFFGFCGMEALGHPPAASSEFDHERAGCNDNILIGNDFSYAPAHGIEMTFSFGNRFLSNRLVGNGISGIWGGYSQDTLIAGNQIEGNGEMGSELQRGGVNIEHGAGNRIVNNVFKRNRCGVHYWVNDASDFGEHPWGLANLPSAKVNLIANNTFENEDLALHLRGKVDVTLIGNTMAGCRRDIDAEAEAIVRRQEAGVSIPDAPSVEIHGDARPIGARPQLRGRENIVMTEWGPWNHESPLVRRVRTSGFEHVYELRKIDDALRIDFKGRGLVHRMEPGGSRGGVRELVIKAKTSGVYPYAFDVNAANYQKSVSGTIQAIQWNATFFQWSDLDPRDDIEGWRGLETSDRAVSVVTDTLNFNYAQRGPSDQKLSEALTNAKMSGDQFGMIARTSVRLTKGTWRISTISDDGIRVMVDNKAVVDDWTWHAPKRHEGEFVVEDDNAVDIVVEHFELKGHSILNVELTRPE